MKKLDYGQFNLHSGKVGLEMFSPGSKGSREKYIKRINNLELIFRKQYWPKFNYLKKDQQLKLF